MRDSHRFPAASATIGACLFVLMFVTSRGLYAEELAKTTPWKGPSSVLLEVDFPGDGYHASWQLYRCSCGDLMIRSELNVPDEVVHGDILLVANRAVLVRGTEPDAAEQISVDAPALMMQLALILLERTAPEGPGSITKRTEVAVEDKINYINLDSGGAAGGFPAPWEVEGTIWPQSDTARRFDLEFRFNAAGAGGGEGQEGVMRLRGIGEYAPAEFPLSADMGLEGWTVSWRDENDPAAPNEDSAKTLGELRALLDGR